VISKPAALSFNGERASPGANGMLRADEVARAPKSGGEKMSTRKLNSAEGFSR